MCKLYKMNENVYFQIFLQTGNFEMKIYNSSALAIKKNPTNI